MRMCGYLYESFWSDSVAAKRIDGGVTSNVWCFERFEHYYCDALDDTGDSSTGLCGVKAV